MRTSYSWGGKALLSTTIAFCRLVVIQLSSESTSLARLIKSSTIQKSHKLTQKYAKERRQLWSLASNRRRSWYFPITTIDTQISKKTKLNPAAWLQEQIKHYISAIRASSTKHPPLSENSQARTKYEYSRLANSWDSASESATFHLRQQEDVRQHDIFVLGLNSQQVNQQRASNVRKKATWGKYL